MELNTGKDFGGCMTFNKLFFVVVTSMLLASCTGVEFQGTLAGSYQLEANSFFPLSTSEINFKQVDSFKNEVSLNLNVTQMGNNVFNLEKEMIRLSHENVNINNFNLIKSSMQTDQVIDIAFVVDVTASMDTFIEDAKTRLVSFINSSLRNGIRTRMCLSTFGDYTVKKCDRFYDNDPKNPSTQIQTQELISEISKLRALKGFEDPGGKDFDENPMQAVLDVSQAPFRNEAQKFVILVTDAGFLYAPQNPGSLGNRAPNLNAVAEAIANSQITIFGITPVLPGYTSSLNGVNGIVQQSGGEHYLFQSVMNGQINLNQILDRVLDRVKSSYILTYVLDDYSQIDILKPVEFTSIKLDVVNGSSPVKVDDIKYQATFPDGRPQYIQEWKFSNEKIDEASVQVYVNNKFVNPSEYLISDGNLKMKQPPALSSNVLIKYKYEEQSKNIHLKPLFLNRIVNEDELIISLNGIAPREGDLIFHRDLKNDLSVVIISEALNDDYYKISQNGGLFVDIK